jgi:hypothetical protein
MTTTVPFKTQLGQDELRSRALKLGQRHRTLLFLIDGRRPLAEVLSLAQQAGAATHHFEDLLRLGLVELPPVPTPLSTPSAIDRADEAALTSVELVVPADADAVQTLPAPLVTEVIDELPTGDEALPSALMSLVDESAPAPARAVVPVVEEVVLAPADDSPRDAATLMHEAHAEPASSPREPALATNGQCVESVPAQPMHAEAMLAQPAPAATPPEARRRASTEPLEPVAPPAARRSSSRLENPHGQIPTLEAVTNPAPRRTGSTSRAIPVLDAVHDAPPSPATPLGPTEPAIDIDLPLPDHHEARLLQEVRQLLTETLRIDAPLFSARTFVRVRSAQSVNELINLVWEIQDHMSAKRRSRRELQSLQRARELLGLGNTLVSEDSRADYRD